MANGNSPGRTQFEDAQSSIAALWQRQTNTEGTLAAISAKLDRIDLSLAERNKPNLQAFSLVVTVLVILGAFAYWPIRESQNLQRVDISELTDTLQAAIVSGPTNYITRLENSRVSEWAQEGREQVRTELNELSRVIHDDMVTRNEWGERNRARDTEIAELNRRVDELRLELGGQYTTRDVLINNREEIDELRRVVTELLSRVSSTETRNGDYASSH